MSKVYTYRNSKGVLYYLHAKQVQLRNGLLRTIYYFGKKPKANAANLVPAGYLVKEANNGLPVLAKAV